MNSNAKENGKNQQLEQRPRIRLITGIAVEYTVGPPYEEDLPVIDGNQQATEDDIADAILSDECKVLIAMLQNVFYEFHNKYPNARAKAQIIPINGMPEVDMIELEGV